MVSGCVVLRPDSLSGSLNLIRSVCFPLKHQGQNSFIYMAPEEQMSQKGVATKSEIKGKRDDGEPGRNAIVNNEG